MSDIFRFKRFEMRNSASAQKVGTDGVLLGAWAPLPAAADNTTEAVRILDIGTGTGVIALMLAQRCPRAEITGLDIDQASAEEAALNFKESPWAGRLEVRCIPLQEFEGEPFDLIVSNPPFFINSLKAPSERRSAARHTDTLSHADLISSTQRLLSPQGRLALIYPPEEAADFILAAESAGLHLARRCEVRSKSGKGVKRMLLEFSRTDLPCIFESLDILSGDDYSLQYRELLKEFYLNF